MSEQETESEYSEPTAWLNFFTFLQDNEEQVGVGVNLVVDDDTEEIGAAFGVDNLARDPDEAGIPVTVKGEDGERETKAFLNPRGENGQAVQLNVIGEEEGEYEDRGIVARSLLEERLEEAAEGESVKGIPVKQRQNA